MEFFKEAKKNDIKTTFLGAGSNILFRDNGVKGAVIKLGKNFSFTFNPFQLENQSNSEIRAFKTLPQYPVKKLQSDNKPCCQQFQWFP